jgi:putative transposase
MAREDDQRTSTMLSTKSGQRALRKGRVSQPGQYYVITTVTYKRQPLFRQWHIGRLVVLEMRRLHEESIIQSLAWVIMPDHLHWLLVLGEVMSLSRMVQTFKGRTARRVNQALQRTGSVWEVAFYDHALRRDEDVRTVARYIVANPLRAGLVSRIGDYPLWDAVWVGENHTDMLF